MGIWLFLCSFLALRYSTTAGITERKTIIIITIVRFSFIKGILPKKYPAKRKIVTQAIPPIILKLKNFPYFIAPMPATKGANVLTIGTNLARIIVLAPYFS